MYEVCFLYEFGQEYTHLTIPQKMAFSCKLTFWLLPISWSVESDLHALFLYGQFNACCVHEYVELITTGTTHRIPCTCDASPQYEYFHGYEDGSIPWTMLHMSRTCVAFRPCEYVHTYVDWWFREQCFTNLHAKSFSPVWNRLCTFRVHDPEKCLLHTSHLNGRSPVWTRSWRRRLHAVLNCLGHSRHLCSVYS